MKTRSQVFCTALLLLFFFACKKKHDIRLLELSVDRVALSLGIFQGYTDSFEIYCETAWEIELSPASASQWMELSATQGAAGKTIVKVSTVAANPTTQTATITVKPAGKQSPYADITITQRIYTADWNKMLGGNNLEEVRSMASTPDGGLIIAGTTTSDENGDIPATKGYYDGLVVKMTAAGEVEWTKTFGGSHMDLFNSVAVAPGGGYILCGYTESDEEDDVPASNGYIDAWIVKLDANGEIVWSKLYGGDQYDEAVSVSVTPEGGFIILAETESNDNGDVGANNGERDIWVFKLDQSGEIVWNKVFGGSENERGRQVVTTADGSIIVLSDTYSNNTGNVVTTNGEYDAWVLKLDANGQILWNKVFGGSSFDVLYKFAPTPDNGFVLAGYTESMNSVDVGENRGESDAWVIKIDGAGNKKWSRTYGADEWDEIHDVAVTPKGDLLLVGFTYSDDNGDVESNNGNGDIWLLELNNKGDKKWSKMLGGLNVDYATSIKLLKNGEFVVGAYTGSNNTGDVGPNNGNYDMWLVKFK